MHETGFARKSLPRILVDSGCAGAFFIDVAGGAGIEIRAKAFRQAGPNPSKAALGIG